MNEFLSACRSDELGLAKSFLEDCPSLINERDGRLNLTPLLHAVIQEKEPLVSFLLSEGADSSLADDSGDTPLHHAADIPQKAIVEVLLAHKADPNSRDLEDETPLHKSVFRGDLAVSKLLLEAGAEVNAKESQANRTPLHYAVSGKHTDCMSLLLEFGADCQITDSLEKSSLDLATDLGLSDLFLPISQSTIKICYNSRTMDEPDAENALLKSSNLYDLLKKHSLQEFYGPLLSSGFDSVDRIIDTMHSDYPLTIGKVKEMSAASTGKCVDLLLLCDRKAKILPKFDIKYQVDYRKLGCINSIHCCSRRCGPSALVDTIDHWLDLIDLPFLAPIFKQAGYHSIDLLYKQMHSRHKLNDQLLQDIGVIVPEHREKVLNRLREDCKIYIGANLIPEYKTECMRCSCSVF